jgi:hypothetical protein
VTGIGATIGGWQPCARSAVFSEAELEGLPDPVRRYLGTAVAPGTPLATSAWLRMRGQIKVGRWLPLRARETLDPHHGFTWTARAAEAIWVPTALLPRFGVDWSAGDERHITARYRIETVQVEVHYALDAGGHVRSVVFDRWGDPRGGTGPWGLHPFGGEISSYATFDGLSIPSAGRFGWFFGTDRWSQGELFRYQITGLRLGSAQ